MEERTSELTDELIFEYAETRKRVSEAEERLKAEKRGLRYLEEVIWLLGEKTIRTQYGTLSVSSTSYASVAKKDFEKADQFLRLQFGKPLSEFLVPDLTPTTEKRLAKLLESLPEVPEDLSEFIKIFEKPTFRFRTNSRSKS